MTTESKKPRVWLGALCLLAVVALLGFRAACRSLSACTNTGVESYLSPDGKRKVLVFIRDCGATTSASLDVSLLEGDDELPDEPGNLLIIEPPGGPFRKPVLVAWESPAMVKITYPVKSETFKRVTQLDGVSVRYVEY